MNNILKDAMQTLRGICRRTVPTIVAACLLSASVLAHPGSGIAVDRSGQVIFLDTGSGPWKIAADGKLTHLPGSRFHWLALDALSRFAGARLSVPNGDIEFVGSDPTLILSSDFPIAIGPDGNLYYPTGRPGSVQMMRMLPSGATSVLATLPRTTAGAQLPHINGITTGPDGALYYTEDSAIRRITAKGVVSTVVTVAALAGGPSIPGTELRPYLRGLCVDAKGVIYVSDNSDARVLKITPSGKITTQLQLESPWAPTSVALFGDHLYVLEYLHTEGDDRLAWLPRVRKITSNGKSTIIATVDQMPGARSKPVSQAAKVEFENLFCWEFLNPFLGKFIW